MKHYELLLLPLLMLLDYYLTVIGLRLAEKKYRRHFRTPHYELNPIWQKQVEKKRNWFNLRHLSLVALMTALLFWLDHITVFDTSLPFFLGATVLVYATVIGSHLANIMIFRRCFKHPAAVSGEVNLAHTFVLKSSQYRCWALLVPFAVAAAFVRDPFLYGGVAGILILMLVHSVWLIRAKSLARKEKREPQSAPPPDASGPDSG